MTLTMTPAATAIHTNIPICGFADSNSALASAFPFSGTVGVTS